MAPASMRGGRRTRMWVSFGPRSIRIKTRLRAILTRSSRRCGDCGERRRNLPLAGERERTRERAAPEVLVAERALDAKLYERALVIACGPAGQALGGRARGGKIARAD